MIAGGKAGVSQYEDLYNQREKLSAAAGKAADAGKDTGPQDLAWISLDDATRMVDYSNFAISGRHTAADGLSASVFS